MITAAQATEERAGIHLLDDNNNMKKLPSRRLFTVDEYHAMAETGILGYEERVELVDGEILVIAPIGSEHMATVDIGTAFWVRAVGDKAIVRVGGSLRLNEYNEPEPDLLLLKWRDDYYRHSGAAQMM